VPRSLFSPHHPGGRLGRNIALAAFLVAMVVPVIAVAANPQSNDVNLQVKRLGALLNPQGDIVGYSDPDGRITLTVVRNSDGIPVRVDDLRLFNVNTTCSTLTPDGTDVETKPGPEVSTNLGTFALQSHRGHQATGQAYTSWRFDKIPKIQAIRGVQHQFFFVTEDKQAREVNLQITRYGGLDGSCVVSVSEDLTKQP
jgi:hypothetical protein